MSRRVSGFVVAAIMVGIAAMSTASAQSTVFDFPTWQAEEAGLGDWWREVISAFEESHPDLTVELSGITPSSAHAQQLTIRMAAGDPPGILHLPAARAREFASEGWLQPIDACFADTDVLSQWTPLQSYLQSDGQNLGLLLLGYTFTLFYNQDLLDAAGVAVPTTPEEFVAAIKATAQDTDGDGANDVFGYAFPTLDAQTFYTEFTTWVIAAGGHWTSDGQVTADSPAVRQALTWLKDVADAGAIPQGLNIAQRNQLFYEGKIAMVLTGPWQYAGFKANAIDSVRDSIGVAGQPFAHTSGGASNSIHIPSGLTDAQTELACDFVRTIASPELQRAYAVTAQLPPPRAGVVTADLIAQYPVLEAFTAGVGTATNTLPAGFEASFSEFSRIVTDEACRMMATPSMTNDAVVQNLQRELSRITPD